MTGQLSNTEINNILSSQAVGRIAGAADNKPYIVPVTYRFDGKYIYGQTNEGMKLELFRKNPTVCFEVDTMTDMRNWQSVVVFGKFEELAGEEASVAERILFGRIFSLMTKSTIHSQGHEVTSEVCDKTRMKQVIYRIHIDKITGRFENQH